jgi:hypothetical protein
MKNLIVGAASLTATLFVYGNIHAQPIESRDRPIEESRKGESTGSGAVSSTGTTRSKQGSAQTCPACPACPACESAETVLRNEVQKRAVDALTSFKARKCTDALKDAEWVLLFDPSDADAQYILFKCYKDGANYEKVRSTCKAVDDIAADHKPGQWSSDREALLALLLSECADTRANAPRVQIKTTYAQPLPKGVQIVVSVNGAMVPPPKGGAQDVREFIVDPDKDYDFSASVEGMAPEEAWSSRSVHRKFSLPHGNKLDASTRVIDTVTLHLTPPPKPITSRWTPSTQTRIAFLFAGASGAAWGILGGTAIYTNKTRGEEAAEPLYEWATWASGATIITSLAFATVLVVDIATVPRSGNASGGSPAKAHMTLGPGFMSFGGTF